MEDRVETLLDVKDEADNSRNYEDMEEVTVFAESLSNGKEEKALASTKEKVLYFHSDYSFLDSDEEVESTKKEEEDPDFVPERLHIKVEKQDGVAIETTPTGRPKKTFQCPVCSLVIYGKRKLEEHKITQHGQPEQCKECNHWVKNLKIHVLRYHAPKKRSCPMCDKKFVFPWEVRKHIEVDHEASPSISDVIPCKICGKQVMEKWLHKHNERMHSSKKEMFSCIFCDFKGESKMAVVKHTNDEHEKLTVQCPYCCKEVFNLEKHVKSHDRSKYECLTCGEKFGYSDEAREHYMKTHIDPVELEMGIGHIGNTKIYKKLYTAPSELKVEKCKFCDYKSNNAGNVIKHQQTIHEGITEPCDICGKNYKDVKSHKRAVHFKVRPFKCPHCSYGALNNNALKNHIIAKHTGNIHRKLCPHCPMRVKDLESHIENSHVNPQPKDKKHACDTCPYRTHVKSALNSHIKMTHLKLSKPCPVCEKNIIVSKMRDHMKCHQINQYSCVACGKTYREKFDLSKHILYFHRKFRTPCKYCGKKEVTNIKSHVRFSHPEITEKVDISADLEQIRIIKRQLDQRSEYYGEQDVIETGETDPIDANVES
eukprot:GFUD01002916.1.p1 GENE.GFUD01002916.1~~GFUD01002916.1.p1  ORF type:complete len:596 (-),score=115.32 GFUD01002916.1:243-2030(-)